MGVCVSYVISDMRLFVMNYCEFIVFIPKGGRPERYASNPSWLMSWVVRREDPEILAFTLGSGDSSYGHECSRQIHCCRRYWSVGRECFCEHGGHWWSPITRFYSWNTLICVEAIIHNNCPVLTSSWHVAFAGGSGYPYQGSKHRRTSGSNISRMQVRSSLLHWFLCCNTICFEIQGVSKRALELYSKCYCVASVTKMFALKGLQTVHRSRYWNTITELFSKHPALSVDVTIPDETRCILLHYDSSKHCTCPLNKCIYRPPL
jgi:hypothetical protein